MSSPFGGPGRVQVFARTRPTPDFPHDMIQLESDKKVKHFGIHLCTLLNFHDGVFIEIGAGLAILYI